MNQQIILLLLITFVSTKTNLESTIIDFDVKQPFSDKNLIFSFSNKAIESKFFLVKIDSDIFSVKYTYQCQRPVTGQDSSAHHLFIIKADPGDCTINIVYSNKELTSNGTIWIHPFEKEIIFDLEKEKRFAFSKYVKFEEKFPSLFFSISNLTNDTEVEFTHGPSLIYEDKEPFTLKNPFKVCQGSDCKENVHEYKFMNKTDYTIEIKTEEIDTGSHKYYYMDSFSFYKKTDGGNNILINPLIYLLLFMLFN